MNRFHPKGYKNPQQLKAIKAKQNRPVVSFMSNSELKNAKKAIDNRIKELNEGHKVEGGTHVKSMGDRCPTCQTIMKLKGLRKRT